MRLSAEQLGQFEEQGYLVLPKVFTKREIGALSNEATRLAQWQVAISLALGEATPRLNARRRGGRVVLRSLQPVHDVSPVIARFSRDERLLAPLRGILGCEPLLRQERLDYDQVLPGDPEVVSGDGWDEPFSFHTDIAYLWLDGYPIETLSSAVVIDEITEENGPLVVVPGSHRREWPLQQTWPPVVIDGAVSEEECVPVLAPAGSVLVFHSALVHATTPSRGGEPRRMLIFSHYPETHPVQFDRRTRELRKRGQRAEERYEDLVYSGAIVPQYRLR